MPKMPKSTQDTPLEKFRKSFQIIDLPEKTSPTIGKDLSKFSAEKVSELMTRYTAWREYTEDLLVEALVERTNAEQKYSDKYDQFLLVAEGSNRDLRHANIMQNVEMQKLQRVKMNAEMYHTLLQGKLESFNNCLTIISREISRRSGMPWK